MVGWRCQGGVECSSGGEAELRVRKVEERSEGEEGKDGGRGRKREKRVGCGECCNVRGREWKGRR